MRPPSILAMLGRLALWFAALGVDAQFEIRLVDSFGAVMDGSESLTGRVEVRYGGGAWGTVCDDYWTWYPQNADVVCGELFGTAAVTYDDSSYGFAEAASTVPIWVDNLRCGGGEASVYDCARNDWGTTNCYHSEDIHLTCEAVAVVADAPTPGPTPQPTWDCAKVVRVGTFDEANPRAPAPRDDDDDDV